VESFTFQNTEELNRIKGISESIEKEYVRARNGRVCAALYEDLIAGESDVKREGVWQKKKKRKKGVGGDEDYAEEGEEEEDSYDDVERVASLERAAYTTLYLLQELEKSTHQLSLITSGEQKINNTNNSNATIAQEEFEKSQFLTKLAPRIRRLESDTTKCLIDRLDAIFSQIMKHEQQSSSDNSNNSTSLEERDSLLSIGHCLRGLALLSKGKEAESVFARVAVMPILRSKITIGKLDEGGSRGECAGLFTLLDDITCSIESRFGNVLRLSESIFGTACSNNGSNAMEVDLVTAGVWIPIATALMADPSVRMQLFSPGIASILQANYMALDVFLSELPERLLKEDSKASKDPEDAKNGMVEGSGGVVIPEASVHISDLYFTSTKRISQEAIEAAKSRIYVHPMTSQFSKKWNLPIYYQLRFADSCTRLNKAIETVQTQGWDANVFTGTSKEGKQLMEDFGFEVPFFVELYDTLMGLWKPDVILKPLTHRFLRGAVQLLGRVLEFVKNGMNETDAKDHTTNTSNGHANSTAPQHAKTFSWGRNPQHVATIAWELTVLENTLTQDYLTKILGAIAPEQPRSSSSTTQELTTLLSEYLEDASMEIAPLLSTAWNDIISNIFIAKCTTPLQAVKGVAATYRMTNRPPPTLPSPFVSTITRPLIEFDKEFASRTPPQVGDEWKRNIISVVSDSYRIAVEELLDTVRRTEVALKNRKARKSTAGGGKKLSDGDKVKLQLRLDYNEFFNGVTTLLGEADSDDNNDGFFGVEGLKILEELTREAEALQSTGSAAKTG